MVFLIGLFTVVMVLTCVVLILLVLLQLPKKEAGAGLAFGGAASDALFGAGSGNVLTKVTKYAATIFFALAVLLSILYGIRVRQGKSSFGTLLGPPKSGPATTTPPAPAPSKPGAATAPAPGSSPLLATPIESTNQPAPTAKPAPAAPAPTNAAAPSK